MGFGKKIKKCVKCSSNNIIYLCDNCHVFWCENCAKEEDYRCTECSPSDLIKLKNGGKQNERAPATKKKTQYKKNKGDLIDSLFGF